MSGVDRAVVRSLWQHVEPLHAVTYFAPEVADALAGTGLRGWWTGYMAARSAPLGRVPPEVVTAALFGFAPERVARAIPAAWEVTDPATVLAARAAALDHALDRLLGGVLPGADLDRVVVLAERAAEGARATTAGRPLAAAHAALARPASSWGRAWLAATVLREHRGDGHVAALVCAGLGGCDANVLAAAAGVVPPDEQQRNRGWSDDAWASSVVSLVARGLLEPDGGLGQAGRELRDEVERATDEAARAPVEALGFEGVAELCQLLDPAVDALAAMGTITYPNAMGLTRPG